MGQRKSAPRGVTDSTGGDRGSAPFHSPGPAGVKVQAAPPLGASHHRQGSGSEASTASRSPCSLARQAVRSLLPPPRPVPSALSSPTFPSADLPLADFPNFFRISDSLADFLRRLNSIAQNSWWAEFCPSTSKNHLDVFFFAPAGMVKKIRFFSAHRSPPPKPALERCTLTRGSSPPAGTGCGSAAHTWR